MGGYIVGLLNFLCVKYGDPVVHMFHNFFQSKKKSVFGSFIQSASPLFNLL